MEYVRSAVSSALSLVTGGSNDVPQSQPLSDDQVQNNAFGFGWKVSDMDRLRRFICLGSEGGTYYVKEKELTRQNAQCVMRLIEAGKGVDVVNEVTTFSVEGRAAKQNPILFVLALCARQETDISTKKMAYEKLAQICRIPTHLFIFIEYSESLSAGTGWGRAHRKAISNWYLQFQSNPLKLAQHVTKYKNRNGWTHRDVLRLAHPKPSPDNPSVAAVLRYIIKGLTEAQETYLKDDCDEKVMKTFAYLEAVENLKKATDEEAVIGLIRKHNLVREHVPTNFLNSTEVWRALLQNMPMTAMIRNLGKMSAIGLLTDTCDEVGIVIERLKNADTLKAAKIHPFNVLVALKTYEQGQGEKGKLKWNPVQRIKQALDSAFYQSFKFVEPTNKRYCLAIDVSGSMCCQILGSSLTARVGSAAMAMVTMRTEQKCEMVAFSTKLQTIHVNRDISLENMVRKIDSIPMGGTDCAQPMLWAKDRKKQFDIFIVYTDSETWAGQIHPAEALRKYRKALGIWDAKLIVCGMSSGGFTIADPEDPGMLDMAGFDSAAPEVMRNFVMGMI